MLEAIKTHLYDKSGKPIIITICRPTNLVPMSELVETMFSKLQEIDKQLESEK